MLHRMTTTTIHKYPLSDALALGIDSVYAVIDTHEGAIVRHAGTISSGPCLWVEVNPDAPAAKLGVQLVGTGREISDDLNYVGTISTAPAVHVYAGLVTADNTIESTTAAATDPDTAT